MAVADGLGHGPEAAYAADFALATIGAGLERPFEEMFVACDTRLRNVRGIALALAIIDQKPGTITMASVGKFRVMLLGKDQDIRLESTKGIVGGGYVRLMPEIRTVLTGDVLAMFSGYGENIPSLGEVFKDSSVTPLSDQAEAILDLWGQADDDAAILLYRHKESTIKLAEPIFK
jgi:hypothetical protein